MQKLDAKKRKPIYNDRLAVLDFRPKKRKSPKLSEKVLGEMKFVEFQMPSPTSTTSEGVESSKSNTPTAASPVEIVAAKLRWDDGPDVKVDASSTTDDVGRAAQVLLDALGGISSDEEDESEILGEPEEDDDVMAVPENLQEDDNLSAPSVIEGSEAQEEADEDFEEPPLLPIAIDDDDTDDEWRPAYKPKPVSFYDTYQVHKYILTNNSAQKTPSKEDRKPRARRKSSSLDNQHVSSSENDTDSVSGKRRIMTPRLARASRSTPSKREDSYQADVPTEVMTPKRLGRGEKKKFRVSFEV
jgi:hypothetical protein